MFKNYFKKNKQFLKNKQGGMTLIELLVVIGIFLVVSSLVMYDYGSFKSATSTQNLANDIALSVRKAQSFAIGVRGINLDFQYGHGAHFTTDSDSSNPLAGSNKSFILFTDISNTNIYDYNTDNTCEIPYVGNECEEILTINGSDEISGFYLNEGTTELKGSLDIVFLRPHPDAKFCFIEEGENDCATNLSSVTIKVTNGQPDKLISREITIWNTGQISVN